MNYFLLLVIVGLSGYIYYQHNQDQQEIATLQQQVDAQGRTAPEAAKSANPSGNLSQPVAAAQPVPVVMPSSGNSAFAPPHSDAIDAAADAARAAAAAPVSNSLATVTTLDGHTYKNCRVLKIESDGVTFNHDDGITKVLFPFLPPNLQKQFGYDPQKAEAQTEAQIRYDEQVEAATNSAGAAPTSP